MISGLTVCAPQSGLDYIQKDNFYDSVINVVTKLGKKKFSL